MLRFFKCSNYEILKLENYINDDVIYHLKIIYLEQETKFEFVLIMLNFRFNEFYFRKFKLYI